MIKVKGDPIWRGPVTERAVTKPVTKLAKVVTKLPRVTKLVSSPVTKSKGGRPTKFGTDADRQKAYRERNRDRLRAIDRASGDLRRKLVAADG